MMMQMLGSFAEFEREMIRERTRAGLREAREKGRVPDESQNHRRTEEGNHRSRRIRPKVRRRDGAVVQDSPCDHLALRLPSPSYRKASLKTLACSFGKILR